MDIVHVTWEYPPVVYGGLGRHVDALAAAQVAAGHRVTVVTQQPPGSPSNEIAQGVQIVRVAPDGPFPYHLPSLLTWVGHLDHRIGCAAAGVSNADIVHAHDWVVGRAGTAASRALDAPLVATIHATESGRHQGWLPDDVSRSVHLIEQWLADEADEIIVCSHWMADEVARAHHTDPARITVVPNGIDATAYQPAATIPRNLSRGAPRVSFVGRIEWEKGVFVAVAAMPKVIAVHPQAQLRIVGTGGQSHAVEAAVAEHGLADHVQLLGHVDEPTLRAVYSSSDLSLAPSSYEPFGLVALEAAAMGVPLIVGDTGGLAEFVTDERGRRCRPNDPDDLADQILTALASPADTARRVEAAQVALADFTWSAIADRTEQVYRKARRTRNPGRVLAVRPNPI